MQLMITMIYYHINLVASFVNNKAGFCSPTNSKQAMFYMATHYNSYYQDSFVYVSQSELSSQGLAKACQRQFLGTALAGPHKQKCLVTLC